MPEIVALSVFRVDEHTDDQGWHTVVHVRDDNGNEYEMCQDTESPQEGLALCMDALILAKDKDNDNGHD